MDFKDKIFLFVGEFKYCVDRCVKPTQMVEMAGGIVKQGTVVTKDVNYLVIGENGSRNWKDGVCPQKEKALKMQAAGRDITIVAEKTLMDCLEKAGATEAAWLASFNERLAGTYDNIVRTLSGIDWSYGKESKTLTIDSMSIPDLLAMAEDAQIVGYETGAPKPARYSEEVSRSGIKEYGSSDLKRLLPWARYIHEMEYIYAPNLIEVPPAVFAWSDGLMRVELPNTRIIRSGAFYECRNLVACAMPKTLFIGNGAFENCEKLQGRLSLKEIEHIGSYAFRNCVELTAISVSRAERLRCDGKSITGQGTALKYVGDFAFSGCMKLKSFSNKNDNTVVFGNNVFYGCAEIE